MSDNSIFVGSKPFMNYVTAVVMQFTTESASTVIIKARGKFISKAVDVSQIIMKRFLKGQITLGTIVVDSSDVKNKDGKDVMVSSIEITLVKK